MNDYMLIYNFEKIIDINKNNTMQINILSFLNKYLDIQKNDKYEPIFSSTSKYKSFPSNKEFNNKLFIKNNKWKINNYKKSEFEQNLKLYINQLSLSNFEEKSNDLKKLIKNNNSKKNINIFIKELYDKIFFEEKFLTSYISLCKDLIQNEVIDKEDIISYTILLFSKRLEYIQKIENEKNDDIKFKLKRQIYGTVQFISLLYINNLLDNSFIIDIINDLLNSNNIYTNESLYIVWEIIHNKNYFCDNIYNELLKKITNYFNNVNNNRLKLLFKNIQKDNNIEKDKNIDKNINKNIDKNINKNISKTYNLYDYIKIYKYDNNKENFIKNLKTLNKKYIINELIYLELENNNNYIDILQLLCNKNELLDILNNLNIEE